MTGKLLAVGLIDNHHAAWLDPWAHHHQPAPRV